MKSKYTAVCALLASCLLLPNSRLLAESYDLTINFTGMTPHLIPFFSCNTTNTSIYTELQNLNRIVN